MRNYQSQPADKDLEEKNLILDAMNKNSDQKRYFNQMFHEDSTTRKLNEYLMNEECDNDSALQSLSGASSTVNPKKNLKVTPINMRHKLEQESDDHEFESKEEDES